MRDIKAFLRGFRDFQRVYFCPESDFFARLRQGQRPKALVVACSDSRVDPGLLMGCEPGDIFVVRNVANLVPPYENAPGHHGVSAALEYAVKKLHVEHVIVLGHSLCGGINALMDSAEKPVGEFITPWVEIAAEALEQIDAGLAGKPEHLRCRACEQAAVLVSLDNLLSFPWIRERIEAKLLAIHGWYFDMEKGELLAYSPETREFEVIVKRC